MLTKTIYRIDVSMYVIWDGVAANFQYTPTQKNKVIMLNN